jgi:hypothetical protein
MDTEHIHQRQKQVLYFQTLNSETSKVKQKFQEQGSCPMHHTISVTTVKSDSLTNRICRDSYTMRE